MWKDLVKSIYRKLPYFAQLQLAKGRPNLAFYINSTEREEWINYYLGKYKIQINTKSDIERRLLSGYYEEDTIHVIRNFVKPGNICIDVGANVGAVTLALADAVGNNGFVFAFEPGKYFFQRLEQNIAKNPTLQKVIQLSNLAISNKNTILHWQESTSVHGTATTFTHGMDPNAPTISVNAISLDSYKELQSNASIDFIKIDVDGLEYEIIQGAVEIIKKHRPILYIETNLWNEEMKNSARKLEKLLHSLNYSIFKINSKTLKLVPAKFPDFSINILAICKDEYFKISDEKKNLFA